MGRVQALALAAALITAACTKRPPMILGAPMPPGCAGKAVESERCIGWLLDRILIKAAFTPYRDHDVATYVTEVGRRLVAASGDRRAWTFRVLDATEVQAFAGMSTVVYIHRGALALLRDESELAGVLAHEIGHVLGGHTHETFEELAKDLARNPMSQSEQVRAARDDEIQADETAVLLAAKAGYDPHGVERMLRAYAATAPDDGQGRDDSHPAWIERLARVQALAVVQPAGERFEARFRERMASLVVGTDPRNGVLIGSAAVFSSVNVAVDLPRDAELKSEKSSITAQLDAGNAIDLRLVDAHMAPYLAKDKDNDVFTIYTVRGPVALAISSKGVFGHEEAKKLLAAVRTPTAAELAVIKPARVDLAAPRLLWLPPK